MNLTSDQIITLILIAVGVILIIIGVINTRGTGDAESDTSDWRPDDLDI